MFEEWVAMEQFYYGHMAWMLFISVILAVLVVSTILYINIKGIKVFNSVCLLLVFGMIVFSVFRFTQYHDLIQKAYLSNPAVRNFDRRFFFLDSPYLNSEAMTYRESYLPDTFKNIGLYQVEDHQEEIEFLGKTRQGGYLIKVNQKIYYLGSTLLEFDQQVEKPQRVGMKYTLKDSRFHDIGFVEESSVFLIKYQIPYADKDKQVPDDFEQPTHSHYQKKVGSWIVPGI